jgi:hypothetical protein
LFGLLSHGLIRRLLQLVFEGKGIIQMLYMISKRVCTSRIRAVEGFRVGIIKNFLSHEGKARVLFQLFEGDFNLLDRHTRVENEFNLRKQREGVESLIPESLGSRPDLV